MSDVEECKHKETRYLYLDHQDSNAEVGHNCDMMVCVECGSTKEECVDSTQLCGDCGATMEECVEQGECGGWSHERIKRCICIKCKKE